MTISAIARGLAAGTAGAIYTWPRKVKAPVTYSIVSGPGNVSIDANTGVISVAAAADGTTQQIVAKQQSAGVASIRAPISLTWAGAPASDLLLAKVAQAPVGPIGFTAANNTQATAQNGRLAAESVGTGLANFQVYSNRLYVPNATNGILGIDTGAEDAHYVSTVLPDIGWTPGSNFQEKIALVFDAINSNNYSVLYASGGGYDFTGQMFKVVNGTKTMLRDVVRVTGLTAGDTLEVDVDGNNYNVLRNGVLAYSVGRPTEGRGSLAGIGAPDSGTGGAGVADNLRVGEIATPVSVKAKRLTVAFKVELDITYRFSAIELRDTFQFRLKRATDSAVLVEWQDCTIVENATPGKATIRSSSPIPSTEKGTHPIWEIRQKSIPNDTASQASGDINYPPATLLGMNMTSVEHYSAERIFANLALPGWWQNGTAGYRQETPGGYIDNATQQYVAYPSGQEIIGADGNVVRLPTGSGNLVRDIARPDTPGAQVTVSWTGTASIGVATGEGDAVATNVSATTTTGGVSSFTFNYGHSWAVKGFLSLVFYSMSTSDPVRNLDVRETTMSSSARFSPNYFTRVGVYDAIRTMDYQFGTGNFAQEYSWADRSKRSEFVLRGTGWCPEDIIEAANSSGITELYVIVPARATADYITKFARALFFGEGTDNGVALNSNIHVYFERGNEWFNAAFGNYSYSREQALANGRCTQAEHDDGGGFAAVQKEHAYWHNLMSAALLSASLPTNRWTRVLGAWSANQYNVEQLVGFTGTTTFDAVAIAPYFGRDLMGDPDTALDSLFTTDKNVLFPRLTALMHAQMDVCLSIGNYVRNTLGKRFVTYEAQQHYINGFPRLYNSSGQDIGENPNFNPTFYVDFQTDPRMKTVMEAYIDRWITEHGDLMILFNAFGAPDPQSGAWGFRANQAATLLSSPKHAALLTKLAELHA